MPHTYAKVGWTDDGQPLSESHDDVYFSKASGLDETRHVFLTHNQLPQRFTDKDTFTIAETGFGTGLNFLATCQLWQAHAKAGQHLNFISVEKYPLTATDLKQALNLWPELTPLTQQLLNGYDALLNGTPLVMDNITLTLSVADSNTALPTWRAPVDAWFLDGFAPAKNPDMWTNTLFDTMTRLSTSGTTAATFTAAGTAKRGLKSAGFEVKKVRGFGHKRDMLIGRMP